MATKGFDRLNMSIFKGSMVAIATPMNVDGSLDFDSLDNLIEFHVENKTDVIISVGTTGESATLDFEEGPRTRGARARHSGRTSCGEFILCLLKPSNQRTDSKHVFSICHRLEKNKKKRTQQDSETYYDKIG